MTEAADTTVRYNEAAGRLVRPYQLTGGRTRASSELEFTLVTLVVATGRPLRESAPPEHVDILRTCQRHVSVAEISAYLHLPVAIIKVLLADLLACRAIAARAPVKSESARSDPVLLRKVIDGLRKL